ncbi:MAG TPA: SdrD B-like domain-containing protein [Anaerolineales bacterium]|nr:SdrD B-like domain-containing protein [Anaerolineales bacterium]
MNGSNALLKSAGIFLLLAILLTACFPTVPTPRVGGVVQGVVYADTNGNGGIDPGEGPLVGVQVTLTGCGTTQNQVTIADGKFNFTNLPEGTCNLSVSKAGWIFSGSYPHLTYPVPVASNPDLPTALSLFMAQVGGPTYTPTTTPTLVFTDTPTETLTLVPSDTPTLMEISPTSTDTATPIPSNATVTPKSQDANCRFGPGTSFLSIGGLKVGHTVPITGTIEDHSWWQIDNPTAPGSPCWVAASVTTTTGDISLVPILPIPTGLVLSAVVTTPAIVHGTCGGPNATSFQVSITTNGPATVTWHLEIYNGDGSLRNQTSDATLIFTNATTKTFDPGGAYKTDCGNFKIDIVVTAPNNKTGEATWSVVSP